MNKNSMLNIITERNLSLNTITLPKIIRSKPQQPFTQSKTKSKSIENLKFAKNKPPLKLDLKISSPLKLNLTKINFFSVRKREKKKQQESSSDSRHIYQQLLNDQVQEEKREAIFSNFKKNPIKKDIPQFQYVTQKLVGEEAIKKFYQRYKKIEKVTEKEIYYGLQNPITFILSVLDLNNIPPKKLEIIKLKGSEAILDLKNCGLGKSSTGKIISELMTRLDHFQQIDLSYNDINQDLVDILIPKLKIVQKISLAHNKIGKLGCLLLSNNFKSQSCRIKVLNLESNYLNQSSVNNLLQNLIEYKKLSILNLSKNFLTNSFAVKLKKYLSQDSHLKELYLHWNQITEKGAKHIFDALIKNSTLKVLDMSWNSLTGNIDTIKSICQFFQTNSTLIHLDISFCELNSKESQELSNSLDYNHTIFGIHYQGNLGYIDYSGRLIYHNQSNVIQYPIPMKRGLLRRINGIKIAQFQNQFKGQHERDICWICQGWQQIIFKIQKPLPNFNEKSYIQINSENFTPVQMNLNQEKQYYQVKRMCPVGEILFYFTFHPSQQISNSKFHQLAEVELQYPKFLPNKLNNIFIKDIFETNYETKSICFPRSQVYKKTYATRKIEIIKKQKVLRQQKFQYEGRKINNIESDSILARPLLDDNNFYRKCLEFDLKNSRIFKIIRNEQDQENFKKFMIEHYKEFKTVYYYLANNNPHAAHNIFSISEFKLQQFINQQHYQSKRVTMAKIMIKAYTCLLNNNNNILEQEKGDKGDINNKLMNRPQFLEFLVRLAQQKWATFVPNKNNVLKTEQKKQDYEDQEIIHGKKIPLPMPLLKAIQRLIKTLPKYSQRINPDYFRINYLTPECQLVYKGYEIFLQQLFDKYAGSSRILLRFQKNYSNKFLIVNQFKKILLDASIKQSKQSLYDCQQCFLNAKNLQIEDGNKPHTIEYIQFVQALARYSHKINLVPVGTQNVQDIWDMDQLRDRVPLFLRFESLINNIYRKNPDLHNKNINKIAEYGLFHEQVGALVQILQSVELQPNSNKFLRTNLKLNSFQATKQITLQQLINYLRQKYKNRVILKQAYVDKIIQKTEVYEVKNK